MKPKEFMQRWKQGIMKVTPQQRLKVDLFSIFFMLFGCLSATIITIVSKGKFYLVLIFGFMGVMLVMQWIAKYQQLQTYKSLENLDDLGDPDEGFLDITNGENK